MAAGTTVVVVDAVVVLDAVVVVVDGAVVVVVVLAVSVGAVTNEAEEATEPRVVGTRSATGAVDVWLGFLKLKVSGRVASEAFSCEELSPVETLSEESPHAVMRIANTEVTIAAFIPSLFISLPSAFTAL